jgi:uncharacterized membrane protein
MPLNRDPSRTTASAPSRATTAVSAYLLLALAVLCWAGNFITGRGLRAEAPPVALTFWRWSVALAVLAPLTFSHLRGQWGVIRRSWRILVLLALFATVLQHIPIYWGLRDTTATNAALLNSTSPIFIALLSVLLLGQRLGALAVLGGLVSFSAYRHRDRGSIHAARFEYRRRLDPRLRALRPATTVCLRWQRRGRGLDPLTVIAAISVVALAPLYVVEMAAAAFSWPRPRRSAALRTSASSPPCSPTSRGLRRPSRSAPRRTVHA